MNGKAGRPLSTWDKTVVPLGFFDNAVAMHGLLYTMFLFNDVLDATRLRESLESLIERDGWRKVGARLRRNPRTRCLEQHIPSKFTEDCRAFRFYHVEHETTRANHPIASRIPSTPTAPAVMTDLDDLKALWLHPDMPTKKRDYLRRDEPALSLFVNSFHDATVMSISWPHMLFDALGFGELLRAWSLTLQGRSAEVPTPFGTEHDALVELGRNPTEPHKHAGDFHSWIGLIYCILKTFIDIYFYGQVARTVCVPRPFLQQLRQQALRDSPAQATDHDQPFLSDGDLLTAWWAKVITAHLPRGSSKRCEILFVMGLRTILADDMLPSDRPCISNAAVLCSLVLPLRDVLSKPLSHVARLHRQCITEARERGQVEAYAALWRKAPLNIHPFAANSSTTSVACSNWSKAKLFELDFSAAISKQAATVAPNRSGRPSWVQSGFRDALRCNWLCVIGKDAGGDYWMTGHTTAAHWAKIEQAVARWTTTGKDADYM